LTWSTTEARVGHGLGAVDAFSRTARDAVLHVVSGDLLRTSFGALGWILPSPRIALSA
jgi:hypothetical protein